MTPSKQGWDYRGYGGGNSTLRNPGTGTNTVSGIVASSVDGEDFDYRLIVDDDNFTLKNSEHSRATGVA